MTDKIKEFIEKAMQLNGEKYDYSKVKYINCDTKVILICKIHGEFEQTPYNHLKNHHCNKCAIEKNAINLKNNKELFINKSFNVHNNKYDYSKVEYKKSSEKVIIICKIHGDFKQTPSNHLTGYGCKKCSIEYIASLKKSNTNDFKNRSIIIHEDKYDYSKVKYKKSSEKVIIICKKHGDFEQTPNGHLNGAGCKKCSVEYIAELQQSNTNEFTNKATKIYEDKYDYSKVEYKGCHIKVIIICKIHGEFEQIPSNHLKGHGCYKCGIISQSISKTKENNDFIKECIKIHGNKYDYKLTNYINSRDNIIIICKEHGKFEQIPTNHLRGAQCPLCAKINRGNINDFILDAKNVHNDKYDYSLVIYNGVDNKVKVICKTHNIFEITPYQHIKRKQGCYKCSYSKKYSNSQIKWLNFISKYNNIDIQHAENIGEYLIPNTKYKADGYCFETNTIYEYMGDYYHGNPKKYDLIDYNKTTKCTFGDLYEKTIKREKEIKDLGYNLVVIWEYDWNKINKSIILLQRKFKKLKNINL